MAFRPQAPPAKPANNFISNPVYPVKTNSTVVPNPQSDHAWTKDQYAGFDEGMYNTDTPKLWAIEEVTQIDY